MFTDTELRKYLAHPDAMVRSFADWAREYRGAGWRGLKRDVINADDMEFKLNARLNALKTGQKKVGTP